MFESAPVADRAVGPPAGGAAAATLRLDQHELLSAAVARACDRRLEELMIRLARLEALADGVDAGLDRLETQVTSASERGWQLHAA